MNELKPCPFCGGKAYFFTKASSTRGITRGWEFGVFCSVCGTTTPKTDYRVEVQFDKTGEIVFVEDEREKAISAWNRRIDNEDKVRNRS